MKIWMLAIFSVSILLVSCSETVEESTVLAEYLESADSPVDVASLPKYITASDLKQLVVTDGAYIIDLRSSADFTGIGHIEGAHNVAASEVFSHLESADIGDKQLVLACYSGQTAAFMTSLVNMAGYSAKSLKFGMSSWNQACADKMVATDTYETKLVTDEATKPEEGAMPDLNTGFDTGEDILDAQIDAVATDGFGNSAIDAATVFGALDNYYIVNFWGATDYALGHIEGAVQYSPGESLKTTSDLKTLPADKTIVVYCYTGQTSAFITAYLKVLGYDALSLKFGVSGFANTWAGEQRADFPRWNENAIAGYDLVK